MDHQVQGIVPDKEPGGDAHLTAVANLKILGEQVARDIQRSIIGLGVIDTGELLNSVRVLRIGEAEKSESQPTREAA